MSLPATLSGSAITAMAIPNPFDAFLNIFNSNPYFIGIMMLILNLGGRFISLEVTKKQEQFLLQLRNALGMSVSVFNSIHQTFLLTYREFYYCRLLARKYSSAIRLNNLRLWSIIFSF